MASSRAQEEKNLKVIRELMKLPANKRCFDCGQMGPVYANCTIGTFICTSCSGIHRELSHRCKSVSMSTFTAAEVEKMSSVGNENAAKEWHAKWNPSDNPAPDGNDVNYLRKFLFWTYQDRRFCASSSKNGDSTASPPSGKTKKSSSSGSTKTSSRKESKSSLPQPEPLSNILGPNIPPLDVGAPSGSSRSTASSRSLASTKTEAPLINLLDDSPIVTSPSRATAKSSSTSDIMGDLMSLSMAPAPVAPQPTSGAFNPFGGAPAPAPSANAQQIAQLQTTVQNMQNAILAAKNQMVQVQQQIQIGQQQFAGLNPQQREQLAALIQRYQAMTTQFAAMNQKYNETAAQLQQLLAAASQPPASQSSLFDAFGSGNASAFSSAPSTGYSAGSTATGSYPSSGLYGLPTSTSSSNLFNTAPNTGYSMTPTNGATTHSTSSTNIYNTAYGNSSTSSSSSANGLTMNGMGSSSQSNLFGGSYGAAPASTAPPASGGFGNFSSASTPFFVIAFLSLLALHVL